MPTVLQKTMTDKEVLEAIAKAYADPSNWEEHEKDYGDGILIRPSWSDRDKGQYARHGLEIISRSMKNA